MECALDIAKTYLGERYINNTTPFNTWFYSRKVRGSQYPYCVTFISYCLSQSGTNIKLASVNKLLELAHIIEQPKKGCIFIQIKNKRYVHAGFVDEVTPTTFKTVEGNITLEEDVSGVVSKIRPLNSEYIFGIIENNSQ